MLETGTATFRALPQPGAFPNRLGEPGRQLPQARWRPRSHVFSNEASVGPTRGPYILISSPRFAGKCPVIGHRAKFFLAASAFSALLPAPRAWNDKTEALEYSDYVPLQFEELAL